MEQRVSEISSQLKNMKTVNLSVLIFKFPMFTVTFFMATALPLCFSSC